MRRRLFPLLAAGSLAVAIGVVGLWVRSYWVQDSWLRTHWNGESVTDEMVWSFNGRVGYGSGLTEDTDPKWIAQRNADAKSGLMDRWRYTGHRLQPGEGQQRLPSDYPLSQRGTPMTFTRVWGASHIPYWLILLLVAMPPCLWLRRFRSERRKQREGLCRSCGYDLRAHSPGQLCPECGSTVPEDLIRKPMA